MPVAIVHGTHDSFVPFKYSVELAEKIPGARLITLSGANHMLVLNNKSEVIGAIKDFIK